MFGKDKQQVDLEFFTIFDSKTQSYEIPTMAVNHLDLVRQLTNMFRSPEQQQKNRFWLNAEDFSVYRIATFDKKTGLVTPTALQHIANFHEIRSMIEAETPRHVDPSATINEIRASMEAQQALSRT